MCSTIYYNLCIDIIYSQVINDEGSTRELARIGWQSFQPWQWVEVDDEEPDPMGQHKPNLVLDSDFLFPNFPHYVSKRAANRGFFRCRSSMWTLSIAGVASLPIPFCNGQFVPLCPGIWLNWLNSTKLSFSWLVGDGFLHRLQSIGGYKSFLSPTWLFSTEPWCLKECLLC